MKKTLKTATAMFLALIIACGSLTAFAATPADIEWNFDPEYDNTIYAYGGELTVADSVEVSPAADNNSVYYIFDAEEDGCYSFSTYHNCIDWIGIPEKYEDGVYYGEKSYKYYEDYITQYIYYLEAGEYVVGFDFYEEATEEIEIEFLGDIVNFIVNENALQNLIYNTNIYKNYGEEFDAAYWLDTALTIEFENGKDISEEYDSLLVFTDEKITKGEYEVELGHWCFPYRQAATINVIDIRDVVEKIEIDCIENFTTIYYDYTYDSYNLSIGNEKMTITYTDGTTEVVEGIPSYYQLENGAWVDVYYDYDEEVNYCFFVDIAGENYIKEICTEERASFLANSFSYHGYNLNSLVEAYAWMSFYFNNIFYADSIPGSFERISFFFSESASEWLYAFAEISENTARFFDYMI